LDKEITKEIIDVSLSMFRKNFIGIYHGSISARSDYNKFIINTKDAIFDELTHEDLVELYTKKIIDGMKQALIAIFT
jgi:L-fuculose-phosphate aldolase